MSTNDSNAEKATDAQPRTKTTDDGIEYEVPERAVENRQLADAVERLADSLDGATSIAEECPVLSELFHTARTSGYKARDGRHVALLDYDREADEWECRRVTFVRSGAHLRDTGADVKVSHNPFPFLPVSQFARQQRESLRRDARAMRQSAANAEEGARNAAVREATWSEEDYR